MDGSSAARDYPFMLAAPLGMLRPVDAVIGGYTFLAAIPLVVGAARDLAGCGQQLAINLVALAGLALVCGLSRHTRRWPLALLRLAYGPLLFTIFYRQTASIWPVLYEQPFDAWLVNAEQVFWDGQPSIAFARDAPWPWLSELFCLCYFAYYFFIPAMLFSALLTRGYEAAERVMLVTALCFCFCYTLFWLFPVIGPHYRFAPHDGPQLYQGYLFNHLLFLFTSRGEVMAGAFPSSHIAVAVLLTIQSRRVAPRLFPFMVAVTLLLCPAVVYLKAHYTFDVAAGVVIGITFTVFAEQLERRSGRKHRIFKGKEAADREAATGCETATPDRTRQRGSAIRRAENSE